MRKRKQIDGESAITSGKSMALWPELMCQLKERINPTHPYIIELYDKLDHFRAIKKMFQG